MKKIIGNSFFEIDNLLINDGCMVILPGPTMEEPTVDQMWGHFESLCLQVKEHGRNTGKKFSIDMNMYGGACVSLLQFSFRALVRSVLVGLDEDDIEYTVELPKMNNVHSDRSTIYCVAKELGLHVNIQEFPRSYEVGLRVTRSLATKRNTGASVSLKRWIFFLPYDEPTLVPVELRENMSDVYIRTLVNKSKFMLSYTKLKITKHTYKLCNRNNGVEVRTTDKPLARIPSIRINQLTDEHRAHLNLQLMPYGVRVEGVDVVTV